MMKSHMVDSPIKEELDFNFIKNLLKGYDQPNGNVHL